MPSVAMSTLRCLLVLGPLVLCQTSWAGAESPRRPQGATMLPLPSPRAARGGGQEYYADSLQPAKERVRAFERDPANRYTHCIRNVATYECPRYRGGGVVSREWRRAVLHGTAFAYRRDGGRSYLVTNHHVASFPPVTDAQHTTEDLPPGCRLASETLKIVDNEDDDYGADDLPLRLVAKDEALDVAVLTAEAELRLLPYPFGRSAALEPGDAVVVRGFPLGAFQAYNTGKVVNNHDVDDFKEWHHVDFIIDAPLSSGNSGSPVLALNRRTGGYELVGVFHASYVRGAALNAVVGIDQLREFLRTLRSGTAGPAQPKAPSERQRAEVLAALRSPLRIPYIGLGDTVVGVRVQDEDLLFEVFSQRFPTSEERIAVFLDRPAPGVFGTLARVWFGNERGLKEQEPAALDEDAAAQVQTLHRRLQGLLATTLRLRQLGDEASGARQAIEERVALRRTLKRQEPADQDLAQVVIELAERLAPQHADTPLSYAALRAAFPAGGDSARSPASSR